MRPSTVVLLVLTVGLGAYIGLVERFGLSDASLRARRGRVFETFLREEVQAIRIEREGQAPIELHRRADAGDPDAVTLESGGWDLRSPIEADTDFDAVDSLLVAMEYAEDRRRIEGVQDRALYGLDDPSLEASYQVGRTVVPLRFGAEDPQGAGRYVQVGDDPAVLVVGRDLYEAFDHEADHFRSKVLVPARVARGATVLERGGAEPLTLTKRDGSWWRGTLRAERGAVERVLGALEDLRAERFVDEADPPPETPVPLSIRWARTLTGDEVERGRFELSWGGGCGAGEGPELVWVSSPAGQACVRASSLAELRKGAESFFDPHLVAAVGVDATLVEVAGADAGYRLARKQDGAWKVGAEDGAQPADGDAVSELLQALRSLEASRTVPLEDAAFEPAITLRVERRRLPAEVVAVGALDPAASEVPVRRGEEAAVLWFEAAALADALLRPAVSFRERRLTSVEDPWGRASEVRIRRHGGPEERIAIADGEARVLAPVEAPAVS